MARGPGKDELGFVCYMILEDGSTVPWEELRPEQVEHFRERAAERLSAGLSDFYTQRPDEFARL